MNSIILYILPHSTKDGLDSSRHVDHQLSDNNPGDTETLPVQDFPEKEAVGAALRTVCPENPSKGFQLSSERKGSSGAPSWPYTPKGLVAYALVALMCFCCPLSLVQMCPIVGCYLPSNCFRNSLQ